MWKKILLFCVFIAVCFMLPSVFIDFTKNIRTNEKMNQTTSGDIKINKDEKMIRLLLKESKELIELSMDDYIKGVLIRRNAYNIRIRSFESTSGGCKNIYSI